jgi:tRNA threonylcarbamoyl adenosine modification protein YeaZ
VDLSIDTASSLASIALSRDSGVVAQRAWECRRNHTVELLPAIDQLLADSGTRKDDLSAVFVSIGPGMYTGLRVGISIAKGLARALQLPLIGVGRLELDAYPHRAFAVEIVAIHRAGRGELAWAAYRDGPWREVLDPQLSKPSELAGAIEESVLFTGEIDDDLAAMLRAELGSLASFVPLPAEGRAPALAALGHQRLIAGHSAEPALLRPIYLRPPAIGPQSP